MSGKTFSLTEKLWSTVNNGNLQAKATRGNDSEVNEKSLIQLEVFQDIFADTFLNSPNGS